MVVSAIINSIKRALTSITGSRKTFAGKSDIKKANDNENTIVRLINDGLQDIEKRSVAVRSERNYNKWTSKISPTITAWNNWVIAKRNYDSTVSTIRDYRRSLRSATRSQNRTNIKKYEKLIARAETTKRRRSSIMTRKWNTFINKKDQLVEKSITIIADMFLLR